MPENANHLGRRSFLKKAGASGGAVAVATTAGCMGEDNGGADRDDPDDAGDPLPSYTFYNNPEDYNPARHDVINLIAEQWQEVGFDVDVEVLEWGTLIEEVDNRYEFDFAAWTQYQSPDPAENVTTRWTPEHAEEPGQGNYNQYQNEEVGELIREQLQAEDREGRVEAFHRIQEILAEDVPFSPIVYTTQLMPHRSDQLEGWIEMPQGFNRIHQYVNVEPTGENDDGYLRGFWTEALENLNVWSHEGLSKHLHLQDAMQLRVFQMDEEGELDPEVGLVQEVERPDETTIRYQIRDDIEWSDGEPLTADDVAFTYNAIAETQPPQYTTVAGFLDGAEVDGDWVEISLTEPLGVASNALIGYEVYVAAEHVWEGVDAPFDELVEEPVCSGPMEVEYWNPGQELELVARDDYPMDVSLEGILWEIIPESSTVWSYTEEGRINYHPFAQPDRELDEGEADIDNFEVQEAPADGWTHLNINTTREGLDEVPVRQALAEAMPKQVASEQIFYGYFPVGHAYVTPAFEDLHNEDVRKYGNGVDAAVEHLQENEYVVTEDGVYYPAE